MAREAFPGHSFILSKGAQSPVTVSTQSKLISFTWKIVSVVITPLIIRGVCWGGTWPVNWELCPLTHALTELLHHWHQVQSVSGSKHFPLHPEREAARLFNREQQSDAYLAIHHILVENYASSLATNGPSVSSRSQNDEASRIMSTMQRRKCNANELHGLHSNAPESPEVCAEKLKAKGR